MASSAVIFRPTSNAPPGTTARLVPAGRTERARLLVDPPVPAVRVGPAGAGDRELPAAPRALAAPPVPVVKVGSVGAAARGSRAPPRGRAAPAGPRVAVVAPAAASRRAWVAW